MATTQITLSGGIQAQVTVVQDITELTGIPIPFQGEMGKAAEQIIYDSGTIEDRTPTLPNAESVPDKELILTHWRDSDGDFLVGITNTIDGKTGPWYLNKGVSVRIKSVKNPDTAIYEWTKLAVSVEAIIDTYKFADNEYVINSISDMPTPSDAFDGLGTCYRFEAGRQAVFGNYEELDLPYPIVPNNNNFYPSVAGIKYTGTGAFIRGNSTSSTGNTYFYRGKIIGNGTNDFIDLDSSLPISFNYIEIDNFRLGTVKSNFIFFRNLIVSRIKGKLLLENINAFQSLGVSWVGGAPGIDHLIQINGTGNYVFNNTGFIPIGGDAALYIDTAFIGRVSLEHGNFNNVAGGIPFSPGSLDETSRLVNITDMRNSTDSHLIGSFGMERNEIETEITTEGETGLFSSVEDAGGSIRVLTTLTPVDGTVVWLSTGIYNGKYVTSNTVTNVSFEVAAIYSISDSGSWETGWTKISGTTIPLDNELAEMTANNELTFTNLDEHKISINASLDVKNAAVAAAKQWEFCVMKNNIRISGSLKENEMTDKTSGVNIMAPSNITNGDKLSVYTRNISGTVNMLAVNMTITVI